MKLYHATYMANLACIKEQGLMPGQRKNWSDSEDGFVYLAADPDVAISFCETAEAVPDDIYASGICCFEVDVGALDGGRLVADPNILEDDEIEPGCFAYGGKILYEHLKLIHSDVLDVMIAKAEEMKAEPSSDEVGGRSQLPMDNWQRDYL